jgi:hypothetical protein
LVTEKVKFLVLTSMAPLSSEELAVINSSGASERKVTIPLFVAKIV